MSYCARAGLTLTELLLATAVSFVIMAAVFLVDVSRTRMHKELRESTVVLTEQGRAALSGVLQLTKFLERADRIVLVNGANAQFRTFQGGTDAGACVGCAGTPPPSCCFDIGGNYRWDQAALVGDALTLWRDTNGGCGTSRVLARQITQASFAFATDQGAPPPGGEPSLNDLNLIQYSVTWNDVAGTGRSQTFTGQVTSRAIPYSSLGATPTDTGLGLAPAGVSDPAPATCA